MPVTLLDGPLGTQLIDRGIDIPAPLWSASALISHPGQVADIHRCYARAGAVDLDRAFADLLSHRAQLLLRPAPPKKSAIVSQDPETAKGSRARRKKAAGKARTAG